MADFHLFCKINKTDDLGGSVSFLKDGNLISKYNINYYRYNISIGKVLHYFLKFRINSSIDLKEFNGNYSCAVAFKSYDLDQYVAYFSNPSFVELKYLIKTSFNKSVSSLILPRLPGNKFKVECKIKAYPLPVIEWRKNNKTLLTIPEAFDNITQGLVQSFVAKNTIRDESIVQHFLYIDLNKVDNISEYKCILNESQIIINDIKVTIIGTF